MVKKEWSRLIHNPVLIIVLLAIILIPSIYAGFFLASMWDPYGELDKLPVAVVNLDQPVEYEGKTLTVGNDLVDKLKEDMSLNFTFTDYDTAEKGLEDGKYYMVVTIPENFSYCASTVMDDEPQKMLLKYETNPATNYVAMKLSESAMTKIQLSLEEKVTETYTKSVFEKLNDIGTGFTDAADGADRLLDGEMQLTDGVTELNDGASRLAEGAGNLSDGAVRLNNGIRTLDNGLKDYLEGTTSIRQGSLSLKNGLADLGNGASRISSGASDLSSGTAQLSSGAGAVSQGASDLSNGINNLASQLPALADGINSLASGSANLNTGITEYTSGVSDADTGAAQLAGGMAQLSGGMAQLSQSSEQISGNISSICQMAAAIKTYGEASPYSMDDLVGALNSLDAGYTTFNNSLGQINASSEALSEGAAALKTGLDTLDSSSSALIAGASAVSTGASQINSRIPALSQGVSQLASGASSLSSGAAGVAAGASQVNTGAQTLAQGAGSLSEGAGSAADGANRLYDGVNSLVSHNDAISSGFSNIASGASQLSNGAADLHTGSDELANGTNTLADSLPELSDGTTELRDALADGADSINNTNKADANAEMFASPVSLEETKITNVNDNGHAMAAYMMSVGLWVASLAFCLMYPLTKHDGITSGFKWWLSKASVLYPMAILQAVILVAALHFTLGFEPARIGQTVFVACLSSIAFMSLMYYFNVLLGKVGSFLMLIFMVLQLAGSAGTYPIEVSGPLAQGLNRFMPFTYTVQAFRSAIGGGEPFPVCVRILVGIFAVSSVLTIVLFLIRGRKEHEGRTDLYHWMEERGFA